MSQHRDEKKLIIESAYFLLSKERDRWADVLQDDLQWGYVVENSGRHGLNPALFKMIADSGVSASLPAGVLDSLQRSYFTTLIRNQHMLGMMASLLKSYAREGIPVMLLKGAALCQTIYDDTGLRPFSDVDFLVPSENLPAAKKIMLDEGFILIEENYFPIPDERNDELGCEWSYHRDGSVFELHWNLVPRLAPFYLDIGLFWEGAREVELDGERVLIMDPANQLIHLCLHQFKHHWMHLRDLVDVTLILNRQAEEIDWTKLIRNARVQGLERCVFYTMMLCRKVLDAPVDDEHMRELLGNETPNFFSRSLLDLIADNILESHLPRRFWELLLVSGPGNKVRVIKSAVSHPFPRKMLGRQHAPEKKASRWKQLSAAFGSIVFYRKLVFDYVRKTFSRAFK